MAGVGLPREYSGEVCSLARALEVVGQRWTLLIIRDAFYGVGRFSDFASHLKIPKAVLADRLGSLVRDGVLERAGSPDGREYVLTAKGQALWPALLGLVKWGDGHYAPQGPPRLVLHGACGGHVDLASSCSVCGLKVPLGEIVLVPGPGLSAKPAPTSPVSKVLSRQRHLFQSVSQEEGVQVDDDRSAGLPYLPSSGPEAAPAGQVGRRSLVEKSGGPALLERNRPTLAQVAALAGVSAKTASRALNGEPNVSSQTYEQVHKAAEQLDYRLNSLARALRQGTATTLVGLITADLANPFYSRVAAGCEAELHHHGLQLITACSNEDPAQERAIVDTMLDRRVTAIIIATSADLDHSYLARGKWRHCPVVFLDRPPIQLSADAAVLDNFGGGRTAAEYLARMGHRRIAVVGGHPETETHRMRIEGFASGMAAAKIEEWREFIHLGAHDFATAVGAVQDLLSREPTPTAFFCTNNRITAGALQVFREMDACPELVGFDDLELGDYLGIPSIVYDVQELGRQGARLAMERLAAMEAEPRIVVIPTHLVRARAQLSST
jgi:LacI family transcriptional regulator